MTYEYVCPNGHKHERYRIKETDVEPRPCPECLKPAQRAISAPNAVVRGGTRKFHE